MKKGRSRDGYALSLSSPCRLYDVYQRQSESEQDADDIANNVVPSGGSVMVLVPQLLSHADCECDSGCAPPRQDGGEDGADNRGCLDVEKSVSSGQS